MRFYRRYVDDTLAMVPDIPSAEAFLTTLNESHPTKWKVVDYTQNMECNSGKTLKISCSNSPFIYLIIYRFIYCVNFYVKQFLS